MEWRDVKETVGKIAPMAGTLLAGPAGGAVGGLLASALGVEANPSAVSEAVRQDPEAAIKIRQMEHDHAEKMASLAIEAETARLSEINKTMRAELEHQGWFKSGWRPAIGWVFAASMGGFVGVMAYSLAKNPAMIGNADFVGMVAWVFGTMGAALGINVRERSKDKARQLGVEPGGLLSNILTKK